ncbi:MAG: DUF2007 domain-containing protein [Xanthomonadales bacterium]|nr:DUF2007 domain-containing protein [Xanthomonadales bacterium]
MRIVYQAESIIDAHLVRHALEAANITCYVHGEFLSGAIGELPASGLVAVAVDDDVWPQARSIAEAVGEKLRAGGFELDESDDSLLTTFGLPDPG